MSIYTPPLVLRNRILEKYYSNVLSYGYLDAYVEYHNSMHILYCKYNPHLKHTKNHKLIPLLTREKLESKFKLDKFGTPLWVYDLTEQELDSHLSYEEILAQRRLNNNF